MAAATAITALYREKPLLLRRALMGLGGLLCAAGAGLALVPTSSWTGSSISKIAAQLPLIGGRAAGVALAVALSTARWGVCSGFAGMTGALALAFLLYGAVLNPRMNPEYREMAGLPSSRRPEGSPRRDPLRPGRGRRRRLFSLLRRPPDAPPRRGPRALSRIRVPAGGLPQGRKAGRGPRDDAGPSGPRPVPFEGKPMTTETTRATMLPFSRPSIGEDEIREVTAVLRSGWITTGPRTVQFEKDFAAYVGATHALALILRHRRPPLRHWALDLKPGDEILCPSLTWPSTANMVARARRQGRLRRHRPQHPPDRPEGRREEDHEEDPRDRPRPLRRRSRRTSTRSGGDRRAREDQDHRGRRPRRRHRVQGPAASAAHGKRTMPPASPSTRSRTSRPAKAAW